MTRSARARSVSVTIRDRFLRELRGRSVAVSIIRCNPWPVSMTLRPPGGVTARGGIGAWVTAVPVGRHTGPWPRRLHLPPPSCQPAVRRGVERRFPFPVGAIVYLHKEKPARWDDEHVVQKPIQGKCHRTCPLCRRSSVSQPRAGTGGRVFQDRH